MTLKVKIPNIPEDSILVSKKEYDKLKKDSQFLNALISAGVDNWDGYSYAHKLMEEEEEEEEE